MHVTGIAEHKQSHRRKERNGVGENERGDIIPITRMSANRHREPI